MIKLYYVRGINRTDTPYFNTLVEQENYFNEKLISSIDAIYPPHYQNTIQFSNEDLDFNTQCNYISLDFNGKTYYYFIDDMEYLAEDLIKITITMDTFQTFMFNIDYHNARLERETIKRWNNDETINRNYIRENLGTNLFKLVSTNNYDDPRICFLVGKYISDNKAFNPDYEYYQPTHITQKNTLYQDGSQLIIYPLLLKTENDGLDDYIKFESIHDNVADRYKPLHYQTYLDNIRKKLKPNPSITYALVQRRINLNTENSVYKGYRSEIQDFQLTTGGPIVHGRVHIFTISDFYINDDKLYESVYEYGIRAWGDSEILRRPLSLGYSKSITLGTHFDKRYIPQLIDENYMRVRYGEKLAFSTYPLSKASSTTIYGYNTVDLFTGVRNYWLTDSTNDEDLYLTLATGTSLEYELLISESWTNYYLNNIGTLTLGTAINTANTIIDIATPVSTTSSAKASKIVNKVARGVGKDRRLKTKSTITKTSHSESEKNSNPYSAATGLLEHGVDILNKAFAPDSVKQDNVASNDLLRGLLDEIHIIEEVTNIDSVATIYESIGYKVDGYVNGSPIRLNRQIYNYIECSEIDLEITMLCSDDIINDIKDRFIDGLRLWNITSMNTLSLQLGDVCVYDNVETQEEVTNE